MDAGKELYARIKDKETVDEWLRIEMDIYLMTMCGGNL